MSESLLGGAFCGVTTHVSSRPVGDYAMFIPLFSDHIHPPYKKADSGVLTLKTASKSIFYPPGFLEARFYFIFNHFYLSCQVFRHGV